MLQSGALTPEIYWLHYAGNKVAPLRRTFTGAITPETKWLHNAESSHMETDGTLSMRITLTDITERKQAEAMLKLARSKLVSESRYRRLFETAQDGILLLNDDTAQIEDVNPYLIEMLGYTYEEFLGKKLWEVGSFADIAHSKELFAELQSKGYVRYDDLPLKTKAGARFQVEFVSNTYDCEGIKVIQCNIRNITERKRVEELRQNEARMRAMFDTAVDGIITISERGIIERFNPAAERMFGYSVAEVVEKNVSMLMPAPYHEAHDGYLANYMQTGEKKIIGSSREVVGLRKDGTTFPMDLAVSITNQGEREMFIGTMRDISERKHLIQELENARSVAEKASLAKSDFLSSMSHELRSPLNAILGFAQLLEAGSPPPTSAQLVKLRQVTKAGWYLLDLINEILDLAFIESGRFTCECHVTHLR